MISTTQQNSIHSLEQSGLPVSEIAYRTRISTTTIYRVLKHSSKKYFSPDGKISSFTDYLDKSFRKRNNNARKLFFEIKKVGYSGSYATVNRYAQLYQDKNKKVHKRSIRFETQPGEQAQVDWGYCGKIDIQGIRRRLYCFVYVLGYSRMMYLEFTIRQDIQTFELCHIHAFDSLGIPQSIVYDNMKTVVLDRRNSFNIEYNPAFKDFSEYYGFQVRLSPPYWPRTKGKVEAGVKYVKNNFMLGVDVNKIFSLEELNNIAKMWLLETANSRIHQTTKERPIDRWDKEKSYMILPQKFPPYHSSHFVTRHSTQDGLVQYKSNFYSVPMENARRKLHIKEINIHGIRTIEMYYQNKLIANHTLSSERGKTIFIDEHLLSKKSFKSQEKMLRKKKRSKNVIVASRPLRYYDRFIDK